MSRQPACEDSSIAGRMAELRRERDESILCSCDWLVGEKGERVRSVSASCVVHGAASQAAKPAGFAPSEMAGHAWFKDPNGLLRCKVHPHRFVMIDLHSARAWCAECGWMP